ncbi:WhiB family transcriptional regulator [Nocardiopsis sp. EMB25]|uniref:WhiB family transcriptional regulator n=1 Tax=Nocardiopsis sp. EMB25 TaxID=2835867 RepID=UPI0022842BF4|nr:WhiB family transcriptional regulator [Nocardiopsis sp. EMB25]
MGDTNRQTPLVGHVTAGTPRPRPTGRGGVSGADGRFGGPTRPDPGDGGWQAHAACWGMDPDLWFPAQGGSVRAAKRVCRVCPVQVNCLAEAIKRGELYGVWGGASEDERRQFRTAHRVERGGGADGRGRAA